MIAPVKIAPVKGCLEWGSELETPNMPVDADRASTYTAEKGGGNLNECEV